MLIKKVKKILFKFSVSSQACHQNPFVTYLREKQQKQGIYTPKRIVDYLDGHIIGQQQAKKTVAIAMRNRWRRKTLQQNLRRQVKPKNILISGPTGSGKTEIGRRLAKLIDAPFIRVQATKFTEVGFVGKDITKMSLGQVKRFHEEQKKQKHSKIQGKVLNDLADALLGKDFANQQIREKKIKDIKEGKYNQLKITIFPKQTQIGQKTLSSSHSLTASLDEVMHSLFQLYYQKDRIQDRNINYQRQAIRRVQQNGIVFIDQIDKLANNDNFTINRSISREGVQRDLLPILQGTVVNTKIGDVNTDNILFIASGAFSMSKIEDLIPQLLGRLPIRVIMKPISEPEFIRILSQPKYNLLLQQARLLEQEGIKIQYEPDSITQMAKYAYEMNSNFQNIGARRLHAIIQKIFQDISFDAPNYKGQTFKIDSSYVSNKLNKWLQNIDLKKYLI